MVSAFQQIKEIEKSKDSLEKHRAFLKLHENLKYGRGVDGHYKFGEEWTKSKYSDSRFTLDINLVGRLPNQTRIEFDGDVIQAKKYLEEVIVKLKERNWGYIRSTHFGKCDYLWVEFTRNMKDAEVKRFLEWIAPEGSIIDENFASSQKVFPCLYAVHWKHSYYRELPIEFHEGEQIDFDSLNIAKPTGKRQSNNNGNFVYQTFTKAAKIFSGKMELAKRFYDVQPVYFDNAGLWWLWNGEKKCWEMTDEVTIANYLYTSINYDTINSKERGEIMQALKQIGRMYKPKEMPKTWIQFKDKIFDIKDGSERDATKEYFTINPIPYALHKDKFLETPTMDRIFQEWVGKDNVKTLYEIIGYCLLPDYPIHRLFCFIGSGMNGKSCYLRLVEKFVGQSNCCSTELDSLINSRFEITRLHKKLVCMMGETNFNELSKTSILKKLTGQDSIGFEYKNKNPFEEKNYAKILISTNNLPETTDKTIGFYRRWLIIDFPNGFSEQKDILSDIPEEEYEALAVKIVTLILPDLLSSRRFFNEGTIEDRQKKYEDKSNPFDKFISENIEEEVNSDIPKWEFAKRLNDWSRINRFREMSEIVIAKKMKDRNIHEVKPYKEWYEGGVRINRQVRCWGGLKWKV